MPNEEAFFFEHLGLPNFKTCICFNVETNLFKKELPRVDRARNPVGDDKIKTLVTWWY